MTVTIAIPDHIEQQLRTEWRENLPRRALEAVVLEGYRTGALSIGQVAETLGVSVYETDGFLKERKIDLPLIVDEFEPDQAALERLLVNRVAFLT